MGRRLHSAMISVLAAGLLGAAPVDVCVEPSWEAAVAVSRLDDQTPGQVLRPVRPTACTAHDRYRVRFVGRGARVAIALDTPRGERLERPLPWLTRPADAIIHLSRQGRLGAVAVLIEGLIIEDQAMNTPGPAVVAVPSESAVATLDPSAPEPAALAPTPAEPAPIPEPMVVTRRAEPVRRRPRTQRRAVIEADEVSAGTTRRSALDVLLTRPPPPPEAAPIPSVDSGVPVRPPNTRSEAAEGPPPIQARATPPGASGSGLRLGAAIGGALWAPSVTALEIMGRLSLGGMLVQIGGHPAVDWSLGERPMRQSGLVGMLGYTGRIGMLGPSTVEAQGSLAIERLTVQRLAVKQPTPRTLDNLGLDAGVIGTVPLDGGWRVGLRLGGRWMIVAQDILIPGGPQTTVGLWQARLGLVVDWSP